ncbi:hypothetical protein BGZ93_010376 [Podila epicladia]|nr:hypothetical protein BGZ93_010376 [Podila epicladia]
MDRNAYRLFPSELADADLEDIDYPGKHNPYVTPIKTAHLSRKSSVLKNWKDGYFVLTMAGWLHVFTSAPDVTGTEAAPDRSIYVPTAVLGKHSEQGQKQHVFSLDGKGQGGLLHRDNQTFTIRSHSRDEMLEWWTAVSKRARPITVTKTKGHARSATDVGSSTIKRTLSTKVNKVAAPAQGDKASVHEKSPSAGTVTATAATAPAPIATPLVETTASTIPGTTTDSVTYVPKTRPHILERSSTGSTVSLDTGDLATPSILEK